MTVCRATLMTLTGSLFALLLTSAACSSSAPTQPPPPTPSLPLCTATVEAQSRIEAASQAPVPEPGKASISGVLYSLSAARAIPGTVFYLIPANPAGSAKPPTILVGPRPDEGDVRGVSGANGEISLNNIPPGSYYVAIWAPYNWVLVTESAADPTPRLINLKAGERRTLGVVRLSWP